MLPQWPYEAGGAASIAFKNASQFGTTGGAALVDVAGCPTAFAVALAAALLAAALLAAALLAAAQLAASLLAAAMLAVAALIAAALLAVFAT